MNIQTTPNLKIRLSSDSTEMQLDVVHAFLSRSYWAKGIPKQLVAKSISNSLCFGVFLNKQRINEQRANQQIVSKPDIDDQQIAFARVITDKASFAYLADVFVLEQYRGEGISKKLMTYILEHQELQCIRRFMLCTDDAHGLYQQFGFSVAQSPQNLMAIHRPGLYLEQ